MKIILSPAKKMVEDADFYLPTQFPIFQSEAQEIVDVLVNMSQDELAKLFKCNEDIARLNFERYQRMNLSQSHVGALFAYDGISFKYLAPRVFSAEELSYVEKHLYILSGLYGLLKCNDAVSLYRLEMQTKLKVGESNDLYAFWGDKIARELFKDEDCIINLASEEYSRCILAFKGDKRVITCVFVKRVKGKLKTLATEAKMLRGEMVRYMASENIVDVELIKCFSSRGYYYEESLSDIDTWYFVCEEEKR